MDLIIVIKLEKLTWGKFFFYFIFSSLQSCQILCDPCTAARQASLSITNSQNPPKPTSIESMMPSNHLIFCRPLLLLPSIFLSIRIFSNESALHIRWPKYWSFNFNISPSNEHPGLISFRMDWLDLLGVFSSTTVQKHQLLLLECTSALGFGVFVLVLKWKIMLLFFLQE